MNIHETLETAQDLVSPVPGQSDPEYLNAELYLDSRPAHLQHQALALAEAVSRAKVEYAVVDGSGVVNFVSDSLQSATNVRSASQHIVERLVIEDV